MKVVIIFSIFIIIAWLLGMALDVLGLYISVNFASKGNVKISKIGYFIMLLGELLEVVMSKFLVFIPLLFILTVLKII